MFHTILTLSYSVPGIYLFIRIWQLFIGKRYTWRYVLIFGFLFSIYPLSNILEDRAPEAAFVAQKLSDYLLPFFLYLFLAVLATDILLILNRMLRLVAREKIGERTFRNRYFSFILALSAMIVTGGIVNFNTIRTTVYNVSASGRSSNLDQLSIAFVSDFHLDGSVPDRFVESYVRKVKEINPDILLYGGDIVEGSGENLDTFEEMIGSIETKFGSFGALGNHDRIPNSGENFFSRAGITLLRDSVAVIDNSFVVVGRNDSRNQRMEAIELMDDVIDLPVIMIDHRPTDYDGISKTDTDVVLSGHTHKGQMFPINLYLNNLYELSYGHIEKGGTHYIVSSGIRLWGPRVRTTGKSEIVVLNIRFD